MNALEEWSSAHNNSVTRETNVLECNSVKSLAFGHERAERERRCAEALQRHMNSKCSCVHIASFPPHWAMLLLHTYGGPTSPNNCSRVKSRASTVSIFKQVERCQRRLSSICSWCPSPQKLISLSATRRRALHGRQVLVPWIQPSWYSQWR